MEAILPIQDITFCIKTIHRPWACHRLVQALRKELGEPNIVVVDDGLPEYRFSHKYPETAKHCKVINLEQHDVGVGVGRNTAIDAAETEFKIEEQVADRLERYINEYLRQGRLSDADRQSIEDSIAMLEPRSATRAADLRRVSDRRFGLWERTVELKAPFANPEAIQAIMPDLEITSDSASLVTTLCKRGMNSFAEGNSPRHLTLSRNNSPLLLRRKTAGRTKKRY